MKNFKQYLNYEYKAEVIKTVEFGIDPWDRIESPEIDPYMYSQLLFNKGAKTDQWGKNSLFNLRLKRLVAAEQLVTYMQKN